MRPNSPNHIACATPLRSGPSCSERARGLGLYEYSFADWYASLVCPWELDGCGHERLGARGAKAATKPKRSKKGYTKPATMDDIDLDL